MKRLLFRSALLATLFMAIGCGPTGESYTVNLRPNEEGLERTLTWSAPTSTSRGEVFADYWEAREQALKLLEASYAHHEFDTNLNSHTFRGLVVGSMPNDIGGSGYSTRLSTSMGSVTFYAERFRGQFDQWSRLQRRMKSVDEFVDLVIGWLSTQLGEEPGFGMLRQFLGEDFRRDLKNLSLLMWQFEILDLFDLPKDPEDVRGQYLWMHVAQFLKERGYFQWEQVPTLVHAVTYVWLADLDLDTLPEPSPSLVAILGRWLGDRMGVSADEPIPDAMTFLKTSQTITESWQQFMRSTPQYLAALAEWEASSKQGVSLRAREEPDPGQLGVDILGAGFSKFGHPDRLRVTLALPRAPFFTNGDWHAEASKVVWDRTIPANTEVPANPKLCYAIWSEPDARFQEEHFGRSILDQDELGLYNIWRDNLPEGVGREWDAFLDELNPADDLTDSLNRFASSLPKDERNHSRRSRSAWLGIGVELVKGALKD